ncbi:hypothetical protein CMI47_20355 [Candidatus Pacearchaeota archaeon]|nr:hypothetical protein [Candidatus Pacearchaeota archaeon]|tara:strand:- start:410 stop:736 length:327 start_codon:yes stop_codon:yes gene_type:complete
MTLTDFHKQAYTAGTNQALTDFGFAKEAGGVSRILLGALLGGGTGALTAGELMGGSDRSVRAGGLSGAALGALLASPLGRSLETAYLPLATAAGGGLIGAGIDYGRTP